MHLREQLQEQIASLVARPDNEFTAEDRAIFDAFKTALNRGEIRAAQKSEAGEWRVNAWVKQGILLGFRMGSIAEMSSGTGLRFFDKDTYPLRRMTVDEN